jgi:NAD(P)H dehydrogenase (quinone)
VNVLVVYTHPSLASFTAASLQRALAGLDAAGHNVEMVDLYASANSHGETAPDERARVAAADALVFVYPTWWSGPPAMLLGWLQAVLATPDADRSALTGHRIRHVVVITSHGSTRFINRIEGESGKLLFQRALRVQLGLRRSRFRWIALYNIDRATLGERNAHLARVEQEMSQL